MEITRLLRAWSDGDQDAFDAIAADGRYILHIDWNAPDYTSIVSSIRKLKQCSGLAINWKALKKLALWLDEQERMAGEYWSISFVKMVALVLGRYGIEVFLIRDSSDSDWAAITLLPRGNIHLVKKLFRRLFGDLGITWCVASAVGWDSPGEVRKELQRRLVSIVSEP